MELAPADAATIGPVVAAAFAVAALALVCGGYFGLCIYFAISADRRTAPRPVDPPMAAAATEPMPFNWLVPAAIGIVLGFTPCAIAALIHASHVAGHHRAGCIEAARDSARRARTWFWWSVAIGLTLIVLCALAPWIATSVWIRML